MKKSESLRLFVVIVIFIAGVATAWWVLKPKEELTIFQPADINPDLVDISLQHIHKNHRIGDFRLVNQLGDTVTGKTLEGKVFVADFFFTTCQSICPAMSSQMQRVFEKYRGSESVMLLSHTVMPETDSVPVLREYAKQYNADVEKWLFLTGDKKQIYELARKAYFVVKEDPDLTDSPKKSGGDSDEHDFIHTENFVLVDKQKRIRGYYDGTSEKDVNRLIGDIEKLIVSYGY